MAVSGRRRVGKTFLIRETFVYKFTFSHAVVANGNKQVQLAAWKQSLEESGMSIDKTPRDWMEAFGLLRTLIKNSRDVRKVIFIDEMSWNEILLLHYLIGADPFENKKCIKYKLLPVCSEGCPYVRLETKYKSIKENQCPIIKDHLKSFFDFRL